jgi:hypothetical protein
MTSYQYAAAPAPAKSGNTDVAAWALVAVIVALICAGAGWAIARQDTPGRGELTREADLAARTGLQNGSAAGYRQGAAAGRREAALRARTQMQAARSQASTEGYDAGYQAGRSRAGDPFAFSSATGVPGSSGAFPADGFEDVLASGLFGDDLSTTSAYDASGFGSSASTPYLGTTSAGDDAGSAFGLGY